MSEIEPDTDGVSRRTIEKDIEYLEYKGPFTGVDIERYYIGNEKTGVKRCVCATQILTSRYSASLSLPPRNICSRKLYRCWDNLTDCQTLTDLKVLGLDLELNITKKKKFFLKKPFKKKNPFWEVSSPFLKKKIELFYHYYIRGDKQKEKKKNPYFFLKKKKRGGCFWLGGREIKNFFFFFFFYCDYIFSSFL